MADPPPPSYDDAITGDYSSPPPPSFPEPPEPPLFNGETTSLSSGQDRPGTAFYSPTNLPTTSPGLEEQQGLSSSHVAVNVDNQTQHSGFSCSRPSKQFKILFFVVCIFIFILAACLIYIISPGKDARGCLNDPPYIQGAVRQFCPYTNITGFDKVFFSLFETVLNWSQKC